MNTLSLQTVVRNAAAVFSRTYGAVTRRAEQARCSRQTVYQHARQIERRWQPAEPAEAPVDVADAAPDPASPSAVVLDEATLHQLAVTAFAMGISTRQIERLLGVLLGDDRPDHATIGRWVADAAEKAETVLQTLDAAAVPQIQTLAIDEVFWGGGRPSSPSSRRA